MQFFIKEELSVATPNLVNLFEKEKTTKISNRGKKRFVVEIAALHEGISKNYNKYTKEALTEAVDSWLFPYPKPILINHDMNAEPLGRIIKASMAVNTEAVSYVKLRAALADVAAIEKVLDGRYLTGSVGAMPSAAICSICNQDVVSASKEGMACGHERGRIYEGKTCVYEHRGISFFEYSFVNAPGDSQSLVQNHYSESNMNVYSIDLEDHSVHRLTENEGAVNILEHMDTHRANMLFSDLAYGTKFAEVDAMYTEEENNKQETSSNNLSNISFIENIRTIENESDSSAQDLGNMTKQNTKIESEVEISEEQEDVLDVADRLSDQLAEKAADDKDVVEVEEEVEVAEDATDTDSNEVVEEASDATVDEEIVSETKDEEEVVAVEGEETAVEEKVEDDEGVIASESDEIEEAAEEEVVAEESNDEKDVVEDETVATEADLQKQIAKLTSENETLRAQVGKMKEALHQELVEKVIDARIAVGLLDVAEREEALESHRKRSASSLADALVDIRQYAEKNNFEVNIIKGTIPSLEIRARVTSDASDIVETVVSDSDDIEIKEVVIDENELFVDKFSAILSKGTNKFLTTHN